MRKIAEGEGDEGGREGVVVRGRISKSWPGRGHLDVIV